MIWTIIFMGFCGLVVVSGLYITVPITTEIESIFSTTTVSAAFSTSVFSTGYALGVLVFGPLSDRIGQKKVMTGGMVALAIVTLAISFAKTIELFLFLRSVQGFIATTFPPVALAYVLANYPPEKKAISIAVLTNGFLMAGVVAQVVSSWVTKTFSLAPLFIIFAVIYFFCFFGLKHNLNENTLNAERSLTEEWQQMIKLFTKKSLLIYYAISFTLLFSFVGMYATLGDLLSSSFGMTYAEVLAVRAVGIFGIIVSLTSGKLVNSFGLITVLKYSLSIAITGLILLIVSPLVELSIIASVICVAGIATTVPTVINIVGILGGESRGAAIALYTFILFVGASVGPVIAAASSFSVTIITLASALGISLALAQLISRESLAATST
ncbi:MAG: MFS transporter [Bacillota bacterium]|nr:MFS transporter [Bacillota bacterium]